ncbi:hypothetical protein MPSEU_000512400 [Mayamaea pseudoterrestris]|nr:hypothetical protein MPSEU_000512400 [Mayamaea pseudoterrestris]
MVPIDWQGWNCDGHTFALEMQAPWAEALTSGQKTIETRTYELPPALIGRKILILQSPPGIDRTSSLGDTIFYNATPHVRITGWCIFNNVKRYKTQTEFEGDQSSHLVAPTSGFAWKDGPTELMYGWVVAEVGMKDGAPERPYTIAIRRLRSLFQLLTAYEENDKAHGMFMK